jgi:hypothetical protein
MFQKPLILTLFLFFLFIELVHSEEELPKKILPKTPIEKNAPQSFLHLNQDYSSFEEEAKVINVKCLFSKNYNFYSLQALQDKEKDYELKQGDYTYIYNFCRNTKANSNSTLIRRDSYGNEVKLAGNIDGEGNDKNNWLEISNGDKKDGISITLAKGETCLENTNSKYASNIIVHCDAEAEEITDLKIIEGNYSCVYTLEFKSRYGCPLGSTYLLLKLMEEYNYYFMVVMVLLGVFLCFVGKKYIAPTIVVLCGIVACYALTALILSIFPNFIKTELWLFVCLLVCFIIGFIIGYLTRNMVGFYIVLAGGFLGYSVATFLYQFVQNYVEWDPQILYYVCIGVCVVVGGGIGYWLADPILILGLAIFGGYLAMRGVSLVAGNYLDEGMVIDLIKNKEWEQLKELRSVWVYAYLGSWAALAIVGTIIQCRYHRKEKANLQQLQQEQRAPKQQQLIPKQN